MKTPVFPDAFSVSACRFRSCPHVVERTSEDSALDWLCFLLTTRPSLSTAWWERPSPRSRAPSLSSSKLRSSPTSSSALRTSLSPHPTHHFSLSTSPHSSLAEAHHPLGFIPILYDLRTSPPLRLSETLAIFTYLERQHPSPPLLEATPSTLLPERIHELASFAASHLYPKVEFGIVKPRMSAMDEGTKSEAEIAESVRAGVEALKPVLRALEGMLGEGPYAFGTRITAADCLLYPPLADLRSIPEGRVLEGFVKVSAWSSFFAMTAGAKETEEGTLEVGGRP